MTETEKQTYISPKEKRPFIQEAINQIIDRFNKVKYESMFNHDELREWMGLDEPQYHDYDDQDSFIEALARYNRDYFLQGIDRIKEKLLLDYNICLMSVRGYGYRILTPNQQAKEGVDTYFRKSSRALRKASMVIGNIDYNLLDGQSAEILVNKMSRLSFLKSAFTKRRFPNVKEIE
jgi:hypothetical protein